MTISRRIALSAIAAIIATAPALDARELAYDSDPNFSDIALINCGNDAKRARWTEDDFLPYLTHTYADGHEDWFFDAFLLVDTQRGSKKFGNDISGIPASQVDWNWMLDQFFDPELKLHALDALIEKKKLTLGEPPLKHHVVLSLCLPTKAGDGSWTRTAWGRINCLNVNFVTLADRLRCMQWYIDEMIARFEAEGYKNLTLAGVYWVEESIWTNEDLAPLVNDYLRSKGLRSYWIPYYPSNRTSWSKAHSQYKFDLTYLQPNYAFDNGDRSQPKSVLKECCDAAKLYKLGVEMEFETIQTSSALHEVNPELHQRINDYMDAFEAYGLVDEGGGIAYYSGSQGFIDMAKSSDPVNQATMDRMAKMVAKRQAAKASHGGVNDIAVDYQRIAYAGHGFIYVVDTDPTTKCYDLSGRLVHTGAGRFECAAGTYIIVSAAGSFKLLVM